MIEYYHLFDERSYSTSSSRQNARTKKPTTAAVQKEDVVATKPTENPTNTSNQNTAPLSYEEECEILAREFGGLGNGKVINLVLQDALKLIPRKRARVDSYDKLVRRLMEDYGVELKLTSRKKVYYDK